MAIQKSLTGLKKWIFPLISAGLLISSIGLLIKCNNLSTEKTALKEQVAVLEKFKDEIFQDGMERYIPGHLMNQEFTNGSYQFKVTKATVHEGSEQVQPVDGYVFVDVEVSVENISSETQFFYPRRSLQVTDIDGVFYSYVPHFGMQEHYEIKAGEKMTFTLTYEISASASSAKLRINTYEEEPLVAVFLDLYQ